MHLDSDLWHTIVWGICAGFGIALGWRLVSAIIEAVKKMLA